MNGGERRRSALLRSFTALVAVFTLAALIVVVLVGRTAGDYIEARIRAEIRADLDGFTDVFLEAGLPGLIRALDRRRTNDGAGRIRLLIGASGERLAGDFSAWPNDLILDGELVRVTDPTRGTFDGVVRSLTGGPKLLIAHGSAEHDRLLANLLAELVLPGAVALIVALIGAAMLVRAQLARIEAINTTVRAVGAGDVAARVPVGAAGDEYDRLGSHVNAMLDRIAALVSGVRQLSDSVAHEMRAPLARLRARLETARRSAMVRGETGETEAFNEAIAETSGLIATFTALLDIAAAESSAGDRQGLEPIDLAALVAQVADLYEAVAEDGGLAIRTDAEPGVMMLGDPLLVLRMIANIVDNACKFSPAGTEITLRLTRVDTGFQLEVRDRGPGLPAGFAAEAFERFRRGPDTAAVPGHGLGLALVKAIALRHGMTIVLEPADPGLRVVLSGPALSA